VSLINENLFDVYEFKPPAIDVLLEEKHKEYKHNNVLIQTICPACKSKNYQTAFNKYGFHYVQCSECMSLYVQNSLSKEELLVYNDELDEKIYTSNTYKQYLNNLAHKNSFYLEMLFSRLFNKRVNFTIAYFGNKKYLFEKVFQNFNAVIYDIEIDDTKSNKQFDLIILDHFIEKQMGLNEIFSSVYSLLKENAYLYVSLRTGSGIDILTLQEDSKVYPIEHQNLLSIEGIRHLMQRNSLAIKEINTPGNLDVKNILNSDSKNIPNFLKYLKKSYNLKAIDEFQAFIQKNLLSSFATVIAQKELK